MTLHATHPSPFDETCPDCTGMVDVPAPSSPRWPAAWLVLLIGISMLTLFAAILGGLPR